MAKLPVQRKMVAHQVPSADEVMRPFKLYVLLIADLLQILLFALRRSSLYFAHQPMSHGCTVKTAF